MKPVKVGIIGCGNISSIYFKNAQKFGILDLIAAADLIPERVEAQAAEFNIPHVYYSGAELLENPEIELVVNLGTPDVHAEICLAALNAGKHVYVETASYRPGRRSSNPEPSKSQRVISWWGS